MKKIAEKIIVAVFTVTAGNVFSQGIVNSAQRDVVFTNHMEPMKDARNFSLLMASLPSGACWGIHGIWSCVPKSKVEKYSDPGFTPQAHQPMVTV